KPESSIINGERAVAHHPITFAGDGFEAVTVDDGDQAAGHFDVSGLLEQPGCYRYAGAAGAEELGDDIMSDVNAVGTHGIVRDEQPAAQPLLQCMKAVADAALCHLDEKTVRVSQQDIVQVPVSEKFVG